MSPVATFHAQLASVMEVLANTAVAEICELVDSGYAVMQLEITRSRKENEVLRRKLRLMELRAARASALRAASSTGGSALLHGSGRARVQVALSGPESKRRGAPAGEVVQSRSSNQESTRCIDPNPPSEPGPETTQETPAAVETTAIIKVEDDDDDEPWAQPETNNGFCQISEVQTMETEALSPLIKEETAGGGSVASCSWTSGEVSSTSAPVQKTLNTTQRPETSGYDCLLFEPHLQHGSHTTPNPLDSNPSCSSALNSSAGDSGSTSSFPFTLSEASLQPAGFHNSQQRAQPPADEPQHPVRKVVTGRQNTFVRRDGWRQQNRDRGDSGGKSFVCNYCGKTLACFKNLKTHMRVHTGEKPFVCALCGKRFSDSSNLKRHQSVHTGEKRYGCVHCGKRFAQSGSLKVHMTVHTDCKQFRCSYCGKTFISGSHLRRHITIHSGEKQFADTS